MLLLLQLLLLEWLVWLELILVQSFLPHLLIFLRYFIYYEWVLSPHCKDFSGTIDHYYILVLSLSISLFILMCSIQMEYLEEDNLSLRNLTFLLSYLYTFGVCTRLLASLEYFKISILPTLHSLQPTFFPMCYLQSAAY